MSSTITALTSGGGIVMAGDTSGQLELKTNNGTTAMTITTAQNVGVGTSTPDSKFHAVASGAELHIGVSGTDNYYDASTHIFRTYGVAERMRLDSSGRLLVATASSIDNTYTMQLAVATANGFITQPTTNKTYNAAGFRNSSNSEVGYISCTASATSFGTSSDYRLKHDIAPMVGGLAKVSALKPVTYKWNIDNSDGQGFIAHELAEVCPDAVNGEKDAVNEDGTPKYQGIDTSFLVATLTAAIQELNAKVTSLEEQILNLGVK